MVRAYGADHRAGRASGVRLRCRRGSDQLVEPRGRGGRQALLRRRAGRPARALGARAHRPCGRRDRLLGARLRSSRRRPGARRAERRAGRAGAHPEGHVRDAGVAQRRTDRASAHLRVLHPQSRGLDPRATRLEHPRGPDLPTRRRRRNQPVGDPLFQRAGLARRPGERARLVHASHRRLGRNNPRRRTRAARREDGRARRLTPRHPRVHRRQGTRGGPRPGATRRRVSSRGGGCLARVPARQPLGPGDRRVHAARHRRRRLGAPGGDDRRGARNPPRPPAAVRLRGSCLSLRRSGADVRRPDRPLAHLPQHGSHHRIQSLRRVPARRRLGLQPRDPQPPGIPQRPRVRHRRLHVSG